MVFADNLSFIDYSHTFSQHYALHDLPNTTEVSRNVYMQYRHNKDENELYITSDILDG